MKRRIVLLLFAGTSVSSAFHVVHRKSRSFFTLQQATADDKQPSPAAQRLRSTLPTNIAEDLGVVPPSSLPNMLTKTDPVITKLSESIILLLGSSALAIGMGELFVRFELFQDWRYLWPLLGCLYVWDGFKDNQLLLFSLKGSGWSRLTAIIGGFGLLVGGAYDSFMPVWMTGPNVVTNAGISQDSAVVLILLSAAAFVAENSKANNPTRMLLQMTLLAELYKLGESSIDELLSSVLTTFF